VLLGRGAGSFSDPVLFTTGSSPVALVAADFESDGRMDLATANSESSDVSVLLGNGNGTFKAQRRYNVGASPTGLVSGDLDGDGRVDLASANQYSSDVSVLLSEGNGLFKAEVRLPAGEQPVGLAAVDMDGDGRIDLATANYQSNDISVLLNEPIDSISPVLHCPETLRIFCTGADGALADFSVSVNDNCDMRPVIAFDHPPGTLFPPGTTLVTCTATDTSGNRSQCSFEVQVACPRQFPGDCNQDGELDISDPVCLLGHLFLGSPSRLPCGDGTIAEEGNLRLLDWNGDGSLDISDSVGSISRLFLAGNQHFLGEECLHLAGCPQNCN
jgi:hypothetical protein